MVVIRKYEKKDRDGVIDVCYHTGYMGEDCEIRGKKRNHFTDKKLFGLFFCLYFTDYEPENCFVAEVDNKVVGYILGSLDAGRQEKIMMARMGWKILFHLAFITSWRHIRDFFTVLGFLVSGLRYLGTPSNPKNMPHGKILEEYKAELHIDILDGYQRRGIGSRLINAFTNHVKKNGVNGIHLGTSDRNVKAVPFYLKKGFKIVSVNNASLWLDAPGARGLTFAKKI